MWLWRTFQEKDKYGRKRQYISGHNRRKHALDYNHKVEWRKRNPEWRKYWRQKKGRERKIHFMELLGNICESCGLEYDGVNGAVFDFHHKDESNKEFQIGTNLYQKSMKSLTSEVKKCALICANCHRIHHIGEY